MTPTVIFEQTFLDLFPFAVDASTFREVFFTRTAIVKREIKKYLDAQQSSRAPSGLAGRLLINVATTSPSSDAESPEDKIDRLLHCKKIKVCHLYFVSLSPSFASKQIYFVHIIVYFLFL